MATVKWEGDGVAVAQVRDANITGYDVTTTYKVTINNKVVSVIGQGGTATTTATALATALNASTILEFAEITWSSSTSHVIGTMDTAGKSFTCASSVSGGAGTMGAFSDTTANAGPNSWQTADNWSGGAVPVNGDDVVIETSTIPILYDLDQTGVTLTSLTIKNSFTASGGLGLPEVNSGGYQEYRSTYLKIGATTQTIGQGAGNGTGRIKINNLAVQTTLNIYGSGQGAEVGIEPILWKGTHASNVINIDKGNLGVAVFAGDTATILTLREGYTTSVQGDSKVRCGPGVTLGTVNMSGGALEANGAITTVNMTAGALIVYGSGAITTLTINGGSVIHNSTGTITTLNLYVGASIDFSQDMRGKTVTTTNIWSPSSYKDSSKIVTNTNGYVIVGDLKAMRVFDIGSNVTLTRA